MYYYYYLGTNETPDERVLCKHTWNMVLTRIEVGSPETSVLTYARAYGRDAPTPHRRECPDGGDLEPRHFAWGDETASSIAG